MDGITPTQGIQPTVNFEQRQQQQQLLQQIQQQITSLPNNTTIFATVVGADKNNNPIIRYAGLDLTLATSIQLAKGAQLSIKVDNASGAVTLQLLSVDGKLPATQPHEVSNQLPNPGQQIPTLKIVQAFPQGSHAVRTEPETAPVPRAETIVLSTQQNPLAKGVVISPTPEIMKALKTTFHLTSQTGELPEGIKNLPDDLKPGTEINFRLTNIQPPQKDGQPIQAPQQVQAQAQQVGTDNKVAAKQEIVSAQQLENFEPDVKITADGGVRLTALVLGEANNDELLVQTRFGRIVLDNPVAGQGSKLPPGSVLSLQIEDVTLPNPAVHEYDIDHNPLKTLSEGLPSLKTLVDSEAGKSVLNKLAGLHENFASRLIDYMSAVKNNKLEEWISNDLLKELDPVTRQELVTKLRGELQNLQRIMQESGQSWQTVFFPVFDGEELHQARLHVRKFKEDDSKLDGYSGTRFVVELAAGSFGEMQFDGLVRKNVATSNFDLIIRSHRNLETEVKREITEIFNNSAQITGYKGGIDFAVMNDFPTHVLEQKIAKSVHHEKIDV